MYRFLISYKCKSRIRRDSIHSRSCLQNAIRVQFITSDIQMTVCGLWNVYYTHVATRARARTSARVGLRDHCLISFIFIVLNCCCGRETDAKCEKSHETYNTQRVDSTTIVIVDVGVVVVDAVVDRLHAICFCLHKLHSLNYTVSATHILGVNRAELTIR